MENYKADNSLNLEIFNVFTEINNQYSAMNMLQYTHHDEETSDTCNYTQLKNYASPWNICTISPIIKFVDLRLNHACLICKPKVIH